MEGSFQAFFWGGMCVWATPNRAQGLLLGSGILQLPGSHICTDFRMDLVLLRKPYLGHRDSTMVRAFALHLVDPILMPAPQMVSQVSP